MQWFDVDKAGLGKLLQRRGKEFVPFELIQNAWDQNVTYVSVSMTRMPNSRFVAIAVEDDDPDGFKNLSHSFTLFAESEKKGDATRRGRFNLGEKLVLALCEEATIVSTTGGMRFDGEGRTRLRRKRERGTIFSATMRMTNEELALCERAVMRLLPPVGIRTTFNGVLIPARSEIGQVAASLPTEIADEEGLLRRVTRKTTLSIYEPREGEVGTLYEMGIPVVETGDTYHVDVQQKVPLNLDRDNVSPAYLREIRTLVVNEMFGHLDQETANAGWVRDALSDPRISDNAVKSIVTKRFGDKAVTFDPSDVEANKIAVSEGYVVVTGSQMSKQEWANVRRSGMLASAGRVTPSAKAFSSDPNAPELKTLDPADWSALERRFVDHVRRIAKVLLGHDIEVTIAVDATWPFSGAYGKAGGLIINKGRLGAVFFEAMTERAVDFLIHEFGHEFCGDHLSADYYRALTKLGAKLAFAVATDPTLLTIA